MASSTTGSGRGRGSGRLTGGTVSATGTTGASMGGGSRSSTVIGGGGARTRSSGVRGAFIAKKAAATASTCRLTVELSAPMRRQLSGSVGVVRLMAISLE
ncbi:hypothetical protein [Pseudofulvimonas gallinarii]|uniref:Uncharacterized protein n=1 Tax=Pseudofulvimonas gallinarii TaxID=634155 RepID=A0A4R3LKI1_9GAMM|nr:hypothetical protein [Pseudofulvimonas gallinarii]TCT00704.1 hypothetical protein EDC25_10268 [Pseudofulvimonas gallinarii]THD11786.1 hypothetical protein B1808_14200 [Pseudofulvimonas gallinarii]